MKEFLIQFAELLSYILIFMLGTIKWITIVAVCGTVLTLIIRKYSGKDFLNKAAYDMPKVNTNWSTKNERWKMYRFDLIMILSTILIEYGNHKEVIERFIINSLKFN